MKTPKLLYGTSLEYNIDSTEAKLISVPKYLSPELLEFMDNYTNKVDIWALGWIFFEILYRSDPFPIENVRCEEDLLKVIMENQIKFS